MPANRLASKLMEPGGDFKENPRMRKQDRRLRKREPQCSRPGEDLLPKAGHLVQMRLFLWRSFGAVSAFGGQPALAAPESVLPGGRDRIYTKVEKACQAT